MKEWNGNERLRRKVRERAMSVKSKKASFILSYLNLLKVDFHKTPGWCPSNGVSHLKYI